VVTGPGLDGGSADASVTETTGALARGGQAPDPETPSPLAFDRFYESSYPAMVRLARVLVDSPQTAEDLVQDAFVRMHGRWGVVRDPVPYLRRCVVNACRSHHRRQGRERRHTAARPPADDGSGADTSAWEGIGLPPVGARSEARTDDAELLAGALSALPYRQRAAVVLRYYADLPDAQIAVALGCRVGTVASLVHRALERLREVVRDDG